MQKNNELICDEVSERIISITERLVSEEGAHRITVRRIINEMGVTNRVFYNRFHNADEVLHIIYENAVLTMRKSFISEYDSKKEFFEYCMDIAEKVVSATYDVKMKFRYYEFEHDSLTENNRIWWMKEINEAFIYAAEHELIRKDINAAILCYSVWCMCRGYSADAVSRDLSKNDMIRYFRFAFGCFLEGIKSRPVPGEKPIEASKL